MPPQTFRVVRCYKCATFQVEQVKKSNKWKCKLCGEAQSLKKVYGEGSGFDCRKHVQQLNLLRRTIDEQAPVDSDEDNGTKHDSDVATFIAVDEPQNHLTAAGCSRWSRYLTDKINDDADLDYDDEYLSTSASHARQPASNKYVRRSHPYRDQERPNSVRSLNSKPRPGSSEADILISDADTKNKILVDKENCEERKQGPPVCREVTASSTNRSSKWSKFLSSDVMNDDCTSTQLVSDSSTASLSLLPSLTGESPAIQPMNDGESSVSDAAADIFAVADDNLDDLLCSVDITPAQPRGGRIFNAVERSCNNVSGIM